MRILVADDDAVTRRLLEATLVKWGYEVVVACDGAEAWQALQHADAPPLAIVDWLMPGMSGVDLCRKLRGTHPRTYTYVILLTVKGGKEDIITGLESGADDYLIKPVDMGEFRARLSVGERTLSLQRELQQRIDELELLLRRHNLLGEVFRNQAVSADTAEATTAVKKEAVFVHPAQPPELQEGGSRVAGLRPMAEVNDILMKVFEQMGLGAADPVDPRNLSGVKKWEFTAWSGLILKQTAAWLDLKVEMDGASAKSLFQTALGSAASSDEDLLDAVGETLHMIQGHFKAAFDEGGIEVIMPIIPKAILRKDLPPLPPPVTGYRQYAYSMSDIVVLVTLMFSPAPVVKKIVRKLRPLDVVAEPVRSSEDKNFVLLNQGVVLSDHYIEMLKELSHTEGNAWSISVVEPSPLTRALSLQ